MQVFGLVGLIITIAIAAWWLVSVGPVAPVPTSGELPVTLPLDPVLQAEIDAHSDLIILSSPEPNGTVTSPLTLTGKARGHWYYEGSFPVLLTDWDGKIIAEAVAMARGPWMTEDFAPFTATFSFESPYFTEKQDFMKRGSLILMKDNSSGLPENDDALEIPIHFVPNSAVEEVPSNRPSYGEAIDAAHDAARSLEF